MVLCVGTIREPRTYLWVNCVSARAVNCGGFGGGLFTGMRFRSGFGQGSLGLIFGICFWASSFL